MVHPLTFFLAPGMFKHTKNETPVLKSPDLFWVCENQTGVERILVIFQG